jgi:beta-lactamase class A
MSKKARSIMVLVVIGCIAAVLTLVFIRQEKTVEVSDSPAERIENVEEIPEEQPQPKPFFIANQQVQSLIEDWTESLPAAALASVVVLDSDGEEIAMYNPDEVYFAASIYKLYVAYAGYQAIDAGETDPDENYVGDSTRVECLDLMIRESDSPCAEKMWLEIGKDTLTKQLMTYGIENTNMTAITTTASDVAVLLVRIAQGAEISDSSRAKFLESMRTQVYRDTFNKGFSEDITVYNKIGFNGLQEYHDAAIIELSDGRRAVLSVLTNGVGTANIVSLAEKVEKVILD